MSLYERALKMIREGKRPNCRQVVVTNGTLSGGLGESERHSEKNVPFVTCAGEVETRLRVFSNINPHSGSSFARASDKRDTFPGPSVKSTSETPKTSQTSTTHVDKRDTFDSLPDDCPLLTGGHCPPGCRFTTKFLVRMIKTGALPDPKNGCPVRHVCGLFSDWPRTRPEFPSIAEKDTPSPEPESVGATCGTCPAWDAESQRCYSTAYFEHKAGPWYIGEDALKKCPRKDELPLLPSQRQ